MKSYIITSLHLVAVAVLLTSGTAESVDVVNKLPPLCLFKICGMGQIPQPVVVENHEDPNNDSESNSSIPNINVIEHEESSEVQGQINTLETIQDIAVESKECYSNLCMSEQVTQKSGNN